jgi:hypothetical protein
MPRRKTTRYGFGASAITAAPSLSNGLAVESAGENWIWGFWSGLNDFSITNRMVGHTTDAAGLMGEVKKVCGEHPSKDLFQAVREVYDVIAAQHR